MESDDEEHQLGGSEEEEEEDGSSSCGSPRVVEAAGGGHPGSYTSHQWPQSYRQSMDIYSSVQSRSLSGFLGTPTLSRLSSSFLASSFRGKPAPEIIKPLLPTTLVAADNDDDHVDARKSSYQYLPPSRKASSLFKIPENQKPLGGGGGHEAGPYRQCSYTQGVMNGYFPGHNVNPYVVATHSDGCQGAYGYWVCPLGDGSTGYLQPVWMAVM